MITAEINEIERLEIFLRENYSLDQRVEAIKGKKLYSLEIELTRRCNMECIYCYNSSSRNPRIADLDFDLLKRILQEAYDYGIRSITYLGGEPTLHPQINEIIRFTKSIGMEEMLLYTNGTVMNGSLLESINSSIDTVVFHLDTLMPDFFADLHRIERKLSFKYYDEILDNLQILLSSGYNSKKLRHCLTLFRPTYTTLEQTLKWAIQNRGMLTSIFIPAAPLGRGLQLDCGEALSHLEIKKSYEMRAKVEKRPELLLLGPSEFCRQYQITTAYLTVEGFLIPYAGYPKNINCLTKLSKSLAETINKNYEFLTFHSSEQSRKDTKITCKNSAYCFGTQTVIQCRRPSQNKCDPNCWL